MMTLERELRRFTFLFSLLLLLSVQIETNLVAPNSGADLKTSFDISSEVQNVPYVWQEMNGFCNWAATSIAMQTAGAPLQLHELFAVSGIGFSFSYYNFNDTRLTINGAVYNQLSPTFFASDLYGLNTSIYFAEYMPSAAALQQVLLQQGYPVGLLQDQEDAFSLMRRTLDTGYPLVISVDPIHLPAEDYDVLRDASAVGGAHGVVIIEYDDLDSRVKVLDPGVGSFGENFGYPDDGRYMYNMTYTNLIQAWSPRFYMSQVIGANTDPAADLSDRLGSYLRDMFLGVGTTYDPFSPNAYVLDYGEQAFRQLASDLSIDALSNWLSLFNGAENENQVKAGNMFIFGLVIEADLSLQYLSYRSALEELPMFMNDVDLDSFLSEASGALAPFATLADNASLTELSLEGRDSLIFNTFSGVADLLNTTGDIESSLSAFSTELLSIQSDVLEIADAWYAAGMELAAIWPAPSLDSMLPIIAIAGVGVGAAVILIVLWIRRTPSQ
jgi:hypothetical protein